MGVIDAAVLYVHLFFAVILVGGSLFMSIVALPVLRRNQESNILVGLARRFGTLANIAIVGLVLTGVYNLTWYLPDGFSLRDERSVCVILKIGFVIALIAGTVAHNITGRKITSLLKQRRVEDLQRIRKLNGIISILNLAFMLVILLLAVMMQIPP